MNKKYISITIILIIILSILSELHTSRMNQQLQNDRYEAEEKLKNSKEKLLIQWSSFFAE